MAEASAPDEAADTAPDVVMTRIEAALERIAGNPPRRSGSPGPDPAGMIAARLDGLIAQVRDALAGAR